MVYVFEPLCRARCDSDTQFLTATVYDHITSHR